jgi:hypothetical protein
MIGIAHVKSYEVSKGIVIVYKVINGSEEFYTVAFSDSVKGQVWGLGKTVDDALESAMREWDKKHKGYNPFEEVLGEKKG